MMREKKRLLKVVEKWEEKVTQNRRGVRGEQTALTVKPQAEVFSFTQ